MVFSRNFYVVIKKKHSADIPKTGESINKSWERTPYLPIPSLGSGIISSSVRRENTQSQVGVAAQKVEDGHHSLILGKSKRKTTLASVFESA